jgi:hypothetical protein
MIVLHYLFEWKWMWRKPRFLRISRQPSQMKIMIDHKQPENVKYLIYFGSITNVAKCTREIKSRTAIAHARFNKKTFCQHTGLKFKEEIIKVLI